MCQNKNQINNNTKTSSQVSNIDEEIEKKIEYEKEQNDMKQSFGKINLID